MRHGDALLTAPSDRERQLSDRGRAEVAAAASRLIDRKTPVSMVAASPYIRAQQTAELVRESLGIDLPVETAPGVTPDVSPETATDNLELLALSREDLLVVMHQPIISRLIYFLTDIEQSMGTAAIAVVECPDNDPVRLLRGSCKLICVL